MVDMTDFGSWVDGLTCYEQLRAMNAMNDFGSWAQSFGYYEQLRVVVDMMIPSH